MGEKRTEVKVRSILIERKGDFDYNRNNTELIFEFDEENSFEIVEKNEVVFKDQCKNFYLKRIEIIIVKKTKVYTIYFNAKTSNFMISFDKRKEFRIFLSQTLKLIIKKRPSKVEEKMGELDFEGMKNQMPANRPFAKIEFKNKGYFYRKIMKDIERGQSLLFDDPKAALMVFFPVAESLLFYALPHKKDLSLEGLCTKAKNRSNEKWIKSLGTTLGSKKNFYRNTLAHSPSDTKHKREYFRVAKMMFDYCWIAFDFFRIYFLYERYEHFKKKKVGKAEDIKLAISRHQLKEQNTSISQEKVFNKLQTLRRKNGIILYNPNEWKKGVEIYCSICCERIFSGEEVQDIVKDGSSVYLKSQIRKNGYKGLIEGKNLCHNRKKRAEGFNYNVFHERCGVSVGAKYFINPKTAEGNKGSFYYEFRACENDGLMNMFGVLQCSRVTRKKKEKDTEEKDVENIIKSLKFFPDGSTKDEEIDEEKVNDLLKLLKRTDCKAFLNYIECESWKNAFYATENNTNKKEMLKNFKEQKRKLVAQWGIRKVFSSLENADKLMTFELEKAKAKANKQANEQGIPEEEESEGEEDDDEEEKKTEPNAEMNNKEPQPQPQPEEKEEEKEEKEDEKQEQQKESIEEKREENKEKKEEKVNEKKEEWMTKDKPQKERRRRRQQQQGRKKIDLKEEKSKLKEEYKDLFQQIVNYFKYRVNGNQLNIKKLIKRKKIKRISKAKIGEMCEVYECLSINGNSLIFNEN